MFLSIVVPIYKVEKYLKRCLDSCLNQSGVELGVDYEIIAIDDGSPDNSGEIADTLLKDKGIVIHQENKGLSEVRNTGLDIAKGRYVWYVDSDDWIEHHAVKSIKDIATSTSFPDIIMIRSRVETEDGPKEIWHKTWQCPEVIQTGLEVLAKDSWLTPAQFFIVKRSFVIENNIKFKPSILHEDNHYTPRLLYYAKKVVKTNDVLYHSFFNTNSITTTPNPKRSFDLLQTCMDLHGFAQNKNITGEYLKAWNTFISISLNNAMFLMKDHSQLVRNSFNKELSKSPDLFKVMKQTGSLKLILESILMRFTSNYTGLYRVLKKGMR